MSKILTIENNNYIIRDIKNNFEKIFNSDADMFDYLKDNINLEKEPDIKIDEKLRGSEKIILKNTLGKAKKYQATNQMDDFYFEFKKNINESLGIESDEITPEKKLSAITNISNMFSNKIDSASNQNTICKLLADVTLDESEKIFKKMESNISIQELSHLKAALNILINRDYLSHRKKGVVYNLIELRNKASSMLLKRGVIG